jgi:hypothetical protein
VLAGSGARSALHRVAGLSFTLAHPARLLRPEAEARDLDLGKGDGDEVLALLADELALGQILAKLLLDDAADDLLESLDVTLDLPEHGRHGAAGRGA